MTPRRTPASKADVREDAMIREVAAAHAGPPSQSPEEAASAQSLGWYEATVAESGFDPKAPR